MATKKNTKATQAKSITPAPGSMEELEKTVGFDAATPEQASLAAQLAEANKRIADFEAQQPKPVQYPLVAAKWKTRHGTQCLITQTAERAFHLDLNGETSGIFTSLTKARKTAKARAAKVDEDVMKQVEQVDKLHVHDERTAEAIVAAAKRKAELEARLPQWARKELEVLRSQVKGLTRIADATRGKQTRIGYGLNVDTFGHLGHLPSDSKVTFYLEDTTAGRLGVEVCVRKITGRPGRCLQVRSTQPLVVRPDAANSLTMALDISNTKRVKKAARRSDVPAETKQ